MTWYNVYSDAYLEVTTNGFTYMSSVYNFYRWEKSFLKVKFIDYINEGAFWVNGEKYEGFADNDDVIIEVSNVIRSVSSGVFTISNTSDGSGTINVSMDFNSIEGVAVTTENADGLMFEIPLVTSSNPFWVQVSEKLDYLKTDGTWTAFYANPGVIGTVDIKSKSDFSNVLRKYDGPVPSGELVVFKEVECSTDKIQLDWIGRFGLKKSWWFTVEKTIYSSDKQISLQTLDSGFNIQRNKNTSLLITHKLADTITQQYIADIVLSDDVTNVSTGQKVRIDTGTFEVLKRKNDINLLVNVNKYDTI